MKNIIYILVFCFILSCSYRFEGGQYLNENITNVAVKVFKNNSFESNAEIVFTNELIKTINQRSKTKVVDESKAKAVLTGVIKAIKYSTASRSSAETIIEKRVSVIVDVKLLDNNQNIIWSISNFSIEEEYLTNDDNVKDEAKKREAISIIAEECADRLVTKLLVDF